MVHRTGGCWPPTIRRRTSIIPGISALVGPWSDNHERVVRGINLTTMVWTEGERIASCDFRRYGMANDGLTENDYFLRMHPGAKARGFGPRCVAFDG